MCGSRKYPYPPRKVFSQFEPLIAQKILVYLHKGKVCIGAKWPIRPVLGCFSGMKRLGVSLLPPGWDACLWHRTHSVKFAGSHLYTWVERGTVRVKCLAQEHNAVSPTRARTRATQSLGVGMDIFWNCTFTIFCKVKCVVT